MEKNTIEPGSPAIPYNTRDSLSRRIGADGWMPRMPVRDDIEEFNEGSTAATRGKKLDLMPRLRKMGLHLPCFPVWDV
eukprot:1378051-Amorphochlora_amoeboformis.AAC.1